jgi:hypothetical protein
VAVEVFTPRQPGERLLTSLGAPALDHGALVWVVVLTAELH